MYNYTYSKIECTLFFQTSKTFYGFFGVKKISVRIKQCIPFNHSFFSWWELWFSAQKAQRRCTQKPIFKGELAIIVLCCWSNYAWTPFGCRSIAAGLRCTEDIEHCKFYLRKIYTKHLGWSNNGDLCQFRRLRLLLWLLFTSSLVLYRFLCLIWALFRITAPLDIEPILEWCILLRLLEVW